MAEKEERIMIVADEPYYCNSCKKMNNCSKDCEGYKEWFNRPDTVRHFYSRTEAIERMAKAFCMRSMYGCNRCVFGKDKEKCEEWIAFNHIRDAEAALNALLEE